MDSARCVWQATATLVVFNVARAFGVLGPPAVSAAVLVLAMAAIAWSAGATAADLGLRRTDLRRGLLYGLCAFAVVVLVVALMAWVPATSGLLHDERGDISGARLVRTLLGTVLLITVIPEEFAFRGVLLGSAVRVWSPRVASVLTSALFGLWHVAPTLRTMHDNDAVAGTSPVALVAGAVASTFVAGLAFCWLRLRSRSLVASVLAHLGTNGVALVAAWLVVH